MPIVTIKGFWQHTVYGAIYAIESSPYGELIGGAGPLDPNHLQDLESYEYTSNINDWLQRALDNKELRRINL